MGETFEDLIKRLPPHGPLDCVTQTRKDKTINEPISRLPMSEGLYKLFCKLMQKSKNKGLGADQQAMIKKKACTAVEKAFCLLSIELNLGEGEF